jgi:hypothetical protein
MAPGFVSGLKLLLYTLLLATGTHVAASSAPEITAQGFDIAETQEGLLGDFGRLRVRFEAPERIEALNVKERSYEVDLARTPETSHFSLFGLTAQVRQLTDVTLNLENYINQKMDSEGVYTFDLRVTDREGDTASTRLHVKVVSPTGEEEPRSDIVQASTFRFTRVGTQHVSGAEAFGVTWKTVRAPGVVVKLTESPDGASKLVTIAPSVYKAVTTTEQLVEAIQNGTETSALRLETADSRAAGTVFGVINEGSPYILRITESNVSSSPTGTIVTLRGEYKH